MEGVSLYFHFPYCVRKCHYCAFYSVPCASPLATEEQKDAYLSALEAQAVSFPEKREVGSVYFGGGTPSVFGVERLTALLAFVRTHFSLAADCEITVEVNPASITAEGLRVLKKAGCGRLSVGMQSALDEELRFLGRLHTFSDTKQCVRDARDAGFDNISLDLLFALPGQTVASFGKSVDAALSLAPEHISAYSLQLEEGTAFYVNREKLRFPSEDEEEAQYDLLCAAAREAGFRHYEISSFAKEGRQSRHNLRYWKRGDYLGIGAAAHSLWNGKRFSNSPDLRAYLADPLGSNDYRSAERIDETEALEETVMLGLRTDEGIPAELVSPVRARRIAETGLLELRGGSIVLTERGWRVSNALIGQLLF